MTATPPRADLRTLAAEDEIRPAALLEAVARILADQFGATWLGYRVLADRILAAVLPEHRRMVLGEAVDELTPLIEWQRHHYGDDAAMRDRVDWIARGRLFGMEDAQAALRRLAAAAPSAEVLWTEAVYGEHLAELVDRAAAPPDGLSATVPAGNAPAVPEEADGQRATEGDALFYAEMESERDRLAGELYEAQTELAVVKSKPLFSTRRVMRALLEALGDPVDEQELTLRIDDGLRLGDVAQRVIAALARTAAERDVVESAKAWRGNRYASASILELAAAVDALSDAGTQPCPTPSDAKSGLVPLADVLDAVWDIDAIQRWASRSGVPLGSFIGHQQIRDYLAERFAPTTAPEGADERNGHGHG